MALWVPRLLASLGHATLGLAVENGLHLDRLLINGALKYQGAQKHYRTLHERQNFDKLTNRTTGEGLWTRFYLLVNKILIDHDPTLIQDLLN